MAEIVLITGTGTDVGKTITSLCLLQYFESRKISCAYWKPVQSGSPDEHLIRRQTWSYVRVIDALQSYPTPAAPAHCVEIDHLPSVSMDQLLTQLSELRQGSLPVIIEGAGGLHAPINAEHDTWIDFLDQTHIPCVLVGTSTLGTINHTCLSIDALGGHHIKGVVLSGDRHERNLASLRRMRPHVCFHELPIINVNALSQHAYLDELAKELFTSTLDHRSIEADRRFAWHPYTQHATETQPIEVTSAKGCWLNTSEGKLFDATSSWWVNSIGHGRLEMSYALAAQQRKLDHVIYAGVAHRPASQLSERLAMATGMDRCFFSDNGSTSIEVALKMAYQFWQNRGRSDRQRFLALNGSYHGDTNACMSVAATSGFHDAFAPLLFDVDFIDPQTSHRSKYGTSPSARILSDLRDGKYAALILEPLVQGAGGMLMHDVDWLNALLTTAKASQTLLIFDEVFVGFGRTGTLFAKEQIAVRPDILCLSKALTGGTLPLAVTMATQEVFDAFLADDKSKALLHGHSYTANPIACAAALKTLDIYAREHLVERSQQMEITYRQAQHQLEPYLDHIRVKGSIFAGELRGSGGADYFKRSHLAQEARRRGLFIRPLGNTIYTVLPLVATRQEVEWVMETLAQTLHHHASEKS